MRVRIIFRGLTLFTFEKKAKPGEPNQNRGKLTAYLVSHGSGPHMHRPKLQIFGRTSPYGTEPVPAPALDFRDTTVTMELMGHGTTAGVKVDPSFLEYVPDLGVLNTEKRPGFSPGAAKSIDRKYIAATVVIENGTIRSRDFVSWDWQHGNGPVPVAYMDTSFSGFAASEVVVEAGDDSDGSEVDEAKHLAMKSIDSHFNYECFPLVKGSAGGSDDVSPNTVEVLVTNLAYQTRRPLFWNLHYQWLFAAAGFKPRLGETGKPLYANSKQFLALEKAAKAFDKSEWLHDSAHKDHMLGHPFPFIIDRLDKLAPIGRLPTPDILKAAPPPPAGRGMHDLPLHDPRSRPICPFGHL